MIQQPASVFMFPDVDGANVATSEAIVLAGLHAGDAPERAILPEHLAFGAIWLAAVVLGAWRLFH